MGYVSNIPSFQQRIHTLGRDLNVNDEIDTTRMELESGPARNSSAQIRDALKVVVYRSIVTFAVQALEARHGDGGGYRSLDLV